MERLQIDELILAEWRKVGGKKKGYGDVGETVFKGERTRLKKPHAKPKPMADKRKSELIGAWNRGARMAALRPRHLIRIADYFNVTDIKQLITE
jgi:hypothetical protein